MFICSVDKEINWFFTTKQWRKGSRVEIVDNIDRGGVGSVKIDHPARRTYLIDGEQVIFCGALRNKLLTEQTRFMADCKIYTTFNSELKPKDFYTTLAKSGIDIESLCYDLGYAKYCAVIGLNALIDNCDSLTIIHGIAAAWEGDLNLMLVVKDPLINKVIKGDDPLVLWLLDKAKELNDIGSMNIVNGEIFIHVNKNDPYFLYKIGAEIVEWLKRYK